MLSDPVVSDVVGDVAVCCCRPISDVLNASKHNNNNNNDQRSMLLRGFIVPIIIKNSLLWLLLPTSWKLSFDFPFSKEFH